MNHVTHHARKRIRDRLGVDLTSEAWLDIVTNARAGKYQIQKPRPFPKSRLKHGQQRRARVPIYLVPVFDESEGWGWIVPMAINIDTLLVVTVLPPPDGSEEYPLYTANSTDKQAAVVLPDAQKV
jgi:hypothetical protein